MWTVRSRGKFPAALRASRLGRAKPLLGYRFAPARHISLASDQLFHEVSLWVTPPLEQRSAVARDQTEECTRLTNYQLYSDSTLTRLE